MNPEMRDYPETSVAFINIFIPENMWHHIEIVNILIFCPLTWIWQGASVVSQQARSASCVRPRWWFVVCTDTSLREPVLLIILVITLVSSLLVQHHNQTTKWETGEQLWADAMSSKWPLLISDWSISGPRWSPTPWLPSSSSLSTRVWLFNHLVSGSRRRDSSRLDHRYFCQRENKKVHPPTAGELGKSFQQNDRTSDLI